MRSPQSNTHFAPFPKQKYSTIVADPPWIYTYATRRSEIPGTGWRGPSNRHYPTLPLSDIMSLPVRDIASENCVLWLWVVNPMLLRCAEVVAAWGFDYRGMLTWAKTCRKDTIKPFTGNGYWLRGATEHAILAVRGKPPKPTSPFPTWFSAPPTVHSQKPDKAYAIFEAFNDGPKIDLFARKQRCGWDVWGLDVVDTP